MPWVLKVRFTAFDLPFRHVNQNALLYLEFNLISAVSAKE